MKQFKMPPRKLHLEYIKSAALPDEMKQAVLRGDAYSSKHPSSLAQQRKQARLLANLRKREETRASGTSGIISY